LLIRKQALHYFYSEASAVEHVFNERSKIKQLLETC
jgi:hypothetical protein